MADECTDVSNKERFTICLRWVDEDLVDHENVLVNLAVGDTIKQSKLCRDSIDTAFEISKLI